MQIRHNTFGDLRIFSSEMYDLWRRIGELEVAKKKLNCYPGARLVITGRHFLYGLAA